MNAPGGARFALLFVLGVLCAQHAGAESRNQQRDELRSLARSTLAQLYAAQPAARALVERSAGYAVFKNFGTKLGVAGTSRGRGIAVAHGGDETFMKMHELEAGMGFGISKSRLVWIFETREAFAGFVANGRQLGGKAGASAAAQGKGAELSGAMHVADGVWLYQLTDTGVAAGVSLKATQFSVDEKLNGDKANGEKSNQESAQ